MPTTFFVGTEYCDFDITNPAGNTAVVTGDTTFYDGTNSRSATSFGLGAEDTNYCDVSFTSAPEIWIHNVQLHQSSWGPVKWLKIYSGGTLRLGIDWFNTVSNAFSLFKWTGSAWTLLGSALSSTSNVNVKYTY